MTLVLVAFELQFKPKEVMQCFIDLFILLFSISKSYQFYSYIRRVYAKVFQLYSLSLFSMHMSYYFYSYILRFYAKVFYLYLLSLFSMYMSYQFIISYLFILSVLYVHELLLLFLFSKGLCNTLCPLQFVVCRMLPFSLFAPYRSVNQYMGSNMTIYIQAVSRCIYMQLRILCVLQRRNSQLLKIKTQ